MDILATGTASSSSASSYSTNSVTGLVDGINVDSIVSNLMLAARAPVDALQQKVQVLQWRQQDYRTINTDLLSLKNTVSSLRYQGTFLTKQASSSSSAVSATATASALNTSHTVIVNSLATNALLASQAPITSITSTTASLGSLLGSSLTTDSDGNVDFSISDGVNTQTFSFNPGATTLNDVINAINNSSSPTLNVKASWDANLQRFYLTATQPGTTITAQDTNGTNLMQQLFGGTEPSGGYTASGASAQVTVDGVNYTFASNQFTINGVSYTLQGTTGPSNPAFIAVTNNVSSAVSAIQNFVTAYNNTLTALNNMLTEQNYHQLPLTQDEITTKNLTDTEIDDWNTKAKSGLLNGDPLLTSVVNNMQNAMITPVSGLSGQVTITNDSLQQVTATCNQMGVIGITSTYGTLSLDTDKLTEALQSNLQAVIDLFTKTLDSDGRLITDSSQQGLAVRLYKTLSNSIAQITNEAGSSSDLFDNSYIGREIAADNSQISNWNSRLSDLEKRYYTEFNAMEQMLSEMNVQSAWLSQMFSSGGSSGG